MGSMRGAAANAHALMHGRCTRPEGRTAGKSGWAKAHETNVRANARVELGTNDQESPLGGRAVFGGSVIVADLHSINL